MDIRNYTSWVLGLSVGVVGYFERLRDHERRDMVIQLAAIAGLTVGSPLLAKNLMGYPVLHLRPYVGLASSVALAVAAGATQDNILRRRYAAKGYEVAERQRIETFEDVVQQPSERKIGPWASGPIEGSPSSPSGSPNGSPEASPLVTPVTWFDWSRLTRDRDIFPHFLILNKTGGGKSTTAEWICGQLKQPGTVVLAVAPHYEPGDFPTVDRVLCGGRNVGEDAREHKLVKEAKYNRNGEETSPEVWQGEPSVKFEYILDGSISPTACQFLRSLVDLMDYRYKLREAGKPYKGTEDHPFVETILDEYPSYASKPGVAECIALLIREARKVGIRLYILAQGDLLKALGLEGQSDVRENLTYLRLGQWSVEHAKAIAKGLKSNDPDLQSWYETIEALKGIKYPAMVDDAPAEIPDLRGNLSQPKATLGVSHVTLEGNLGISKVYPKGNSGYSKATTEAKLRSIEASEGTYGVVRVGDRTPSVASFEALEAEHGHLKVLAKDLTAVLGLPEDRARSYMSYRGFDSRSVKVDGNVHRYWLPAEVEPKDTRTVTLDPSGYLAVT